MYGLWLLGSISLDKKEKHHAYLLCFLLDKWKSFYKVVWMYKILFHEENIWALNLIIIIGIKGDVYKLYIVLFFLIKESLKVK